MQAEAKMQKYSRSIQDLESKVLGGQEPQLTKFIQVFNTQLHVVC